MVSITLLGGIVTAQIASGDDLDNYKTIGRYSAGSNAIGNAAVNKPQGVTHAFLLKVEYNIDATIVTQTLYEFTTGAIFTRQYDRSSWTSWGRSDGYGCADASTLASLLGALFDLGGVSEDIHNNLLSSRTTATWYYYPNSYASIRMGTSCLQFRVNHFTSLIEKRAYNGNDNTWGEWS